MPGARSRDKEPYLRKIRDLADSYPILYYLNRFVKDRDINGNRLAVYPVRVTVLEFRSSQVTKHSFHEAANPYEDLRTYLQNSSHQKGLKRLFLVEDLDANTIELLGWHLGMDGRVFASQIRDAHFTAGHYIGHAPELPGLQDPERSFTLRYYEPRYFENPDMPSFSSYLTTMANVRRQITFTRGAGKRLIENSAKAQHTHVGHIRRNTSFWSQDIAGGGWNGVILLDPPTAQTFLFLRDKKVDGWDILNQPYQHGYRSFMPWPSSSTVPKHEIPLRTSLQQDIWYFLQESDDFGAPMRARHIQLKIVASLWLNTLEHIYANLSILETSLWGIDNKISPEISNKEKVEHMNVFTEILGEINTWRRRLVWYVDETRQNLDSLAIDPSSTATSLSRESQAHERDFISIHNRLTTYQAWAESLLNAVMAHVNLMETEKTVAESRSLARLTVLGFIFVPISFVCSLFSMGGDFAVGEDRFWVYIVVVVPLTLLILLVGFGSWLSKRLRRTIRSRGLMYENEKEHRHAHV